MSAPSASGQIPRPDRRRRVAIIAGALLATVVVAVAAGLAARKPSAVNHPASSPPTKAPAPTGAGASTPADRAIVLGHSISGIALGEKRQHVIADLRQRGYTQSGSGKSLYFKNHGGTLDVYFDTDAASSVERFNDPAIKIRGVSVESKLAEARAALPGWRYVQCPRIKEEILIAPGGRTFLTAPYGFATKNRSGANAIGVIDGVMDETYCGI